MVLFGYARRRALGKQRLKEDAKRKRFAFESDRPSAARPRSWTRVLRSIVDTPFLRALFATFIVAGVVEKSWKQRRRRPQREEKRQDFAVYAISEVDVERVVILGEKKSGATYVSHLLTDNLFISTEERMYDVSRKVTPRNTLLVLVTKHPIASLVSRIQRPHPTEKFQRKDLTKPKILEKLLKERSHFHTKALELGEFVQENGGAFEIVKYESALEFPKYIVDVIEMRYAIPRRRRSPQHDVVTPHHHTGDILDDSPGDETHHGARRSRYKKHGPFTRRNYYLQSDFLDDVHDKLLKHLKHNLIDTHLEAQLGYDIDDKKQHKKTPPREEQQGSSSRWQRSASWLLWTFDVVIIFVVGVAVLAVVFVAPAVYWQLYDLPPKTIPSAPPQSSPPPPSAYFKMWGQSSLHVSDVVDDDDDDDDASAQSPIDHGLQESIGHASPSSASDSDSSESSDSSTDTFSLSSSSDSEDSESEEASTES